MEACEICGAKGVWLGVKSALTGDRRMVCIGCGTGGALPPGTDLIEYIKKLFPKKGTELAPPKP